MSALCYTSCPVAAPSSQTMKATAAGCEILTLTPHPHTLKILPEALASVLQTLQTAFVFLCLGLVCTPHPPTCPLYLLSAKSSRACKAA